MKTIDLLSTNIMLKTLCLLIAIVFWYFFSGIYPITLQLTVPLYFYGLKDTYTINGPTTVLITLQGMRSDFCMLDAEQLAIHVDARTLKSGNQKIIVTFKELFLPNTIKLIHCNPTSIEVT